MPPVKDTPFTKGGSLSVKSSRSARGANLQSSPPAALSAFQLESVALFIHSHPIEEKIDPEGEMDGVFETCHLAGYEKTKTPPSIGCKVQWFPAALQFDSLPSGIQVGEGNWR
ncbi:MAG: hypothetical protein NTZ08_03480 [Verrucomicrobia bacterium]|nr:hypothetical protein [Verrucomicrobiota bacterium]